MDKGWLDYLLVRLSSLIVNMDKLMETSKLFILQVMFILELQETIFVMLMERLCSKAATNL